MTIARVHHPRVRQVVSLVLTFAVFVARVAMSQSVFELRQYTLHPGQRDGLIDLFDREFVESQEATGITVLGQFRDLDRPDRFVWVRGFPDMPSRATALQAFYGGLVWQENREAANATMIDSDDVLLLRQAREGSGFDLAGRSRPPRGASVVPQTLVVATIYSCTEPCEAVLVGRFEQRIRPAFEAAGGRVLAYYVTDPAPNNFPRLPVREGEHVLVWFTAFASDEEYAAHVARRDDTSAWREANDGVAALLNGPPVILRLRPTARSLIGN